mmetsp:Transcript_1731/g.2701  ORF Transcript_1731/g.2701 Transcript_1731/m.2701 type:complete len:83 (-) Transcript_1731:655-903(-)
MLFFTSMYTFIYHCGGSELTMTMYMDDNDISGFGGDETIGANMKKLAMTDLLSSASVTANHLTLMMQRLRTMDESSKCYTFP